MKNIYVPFSFHIQSRTTGNTILLLQPNEC